MLINGEICAKIITTLKTGKEWEKTGYEKSIQKKQDEYRQEVSSGAFDSGIERRAFGVWGQESFGSGESGLVDGVALL